MFIALFQGTLTERLDGGLVGFCSVGQNVHEKLAYLRFRYSEGVTPTNRRKTFVKWP